MDKKETIQKNNKIINQFNNSHGIKTKIINQNINISPKNKFNINTASKID